MAYPLWAGSAAVDTAVVLIGFLDVEELALGFGINLHTCHWHNGNPDTEQLADLPHFVAHLGGEGGCARSGNATRVYRVVKGIG